MNNGGEHGKKEKENNSSDINANGKTVRKTQQKEAESWSWQKSRMGGNLGKKAISNGQGSAAQTGTQRAEIDWGCV